MIKRWIFMIVLVFFLAAGYGMAADQKVVMELKGMACTLCNLAVRKSLSGMEVVKDVKGSYKYKKAWRTAGDSRTDATLAEACDKAGYTAKDGRS